ncbi:MAG: hypothetical protein WD359_05755 [Dehalococcoidia bacterium]
MAMTRKQLYLPERMDRQLKKEAKRRGISEAALIRERLEHTCTELRPATDKAIERRFIQTLRKARREAQKYVGNEPAWKFNRDDAHEERLERQMPR